MMLFIQMSEVEQNTRLSGRIPTLNEYWTCRMGTSAVGVCLGMLDYIDRIQIPPSLVRHPDMMAL